MFEQAVLPSHPAGKRYWTVAAGFTGELLAIGGLLLVPLVWPEFLPRTQVLTLISLPSPRPIPNEPKPPARVQPSVPRQSHGRFILLPRNIPPSPVAIDDPPGADVSSQDAGVRGAPTAAVLGLLSSLVRSVPISPSAVSQPPKAPPAEPRRISALHPARLLHRVEPIYPKIAVAARIEGTVELAGVIATDGRIRELRVVSGPPLLAKAALDAVREWIYEPTVLNGEPVEVAAPIEVHSVLK